MLSVQDQKKEQEQSKEQRVLELSAAVDLGESSERLAGNADWARFRKDILKEVEMYSISKIEMYDTLIKGNLSADEKLKAVDQIRAIAQQIDNFNFIVGLVGARIRLGEEARKQLEDLKLPGGK